MDAFSDDEEGVLPHGDPPAPVPTDADDDAVELPGRAELSESGDVVASQPGPESPSSAVEVTPAQHAAAESHRVMTATGRLVIADTERSQPESFDRPGFRISESILSAPGQDPAEQSPKPKTRDLFLRPDDGGGWRKLPVFPHNSGEPTVQLLSDQEDASPSPFNSAEGSLDNFSETTAEAPQVSEHDSHSPPPAVPPPTASRGVRLPFPGPSRDEIPSTLEGLVELHERQTAGPSSFPATPPSTPRADEAAPDEDQSLPDPSASQIADDSSLHTLPQVLVTVSLLDAERLVSEEFRSMADEHVEAMREIASEVVDEYNFKLMAELRAVFGR